MSQWYEELFENYSRKYDQEEFTKGTLGEVDFIEHELFFDKDKRILDVGCGTGRHSVELARRGYNVTGVDLSLSMLSRAREKASEASVDVRYIRADARNLSFSPRFDLVIMLCEGAFPLMETDEMNYMILQGAARALKSGGKFIFTTLNGLFPLYHSVKVFLDSNMVEGSSSDNSFDLMTFRDHSVYETTDDSGRKMTLKCNERYYVPSEITWLLKTLGFTDIGFFGCPQGAFSRDVKLSTEDYEMLVIARKT
ncbi:MAG: class I SAM-dependent methyltransferase [Chitinispirillaceae bacterium]